MASPLDGIKVIDVTGVVAGPTCGWILADLGADVIKVEASDSTSRSSLSMFVSLNRHKRSLAADLKDPRGKEILSKLIARSDVLIENLAPGAMDRLGFSYEAVKEMNPRMVYCSIKGYGAGPYESRMATDYAMQAETGILYMTGTADEPKRMGVAAIDMTAAVFSCLAIVLALGKRGHTGRGTFVESGLFETAAFLMSTSLCSAIMLGKSPPPFNTPGGFGPIGEVFTAADGKNIFLQVRDAQWQRFCEEFGLEELLGERFSTDQKRKEERPYILPLITDIIAKLPREELLERFEKCKVNFASVNTPFEALGHPQLKVPNKTCTVSYAGLDKPMELGQLPVSFEEFTPPQTSTVPELGENTEEILGELGYKQDEIAAFAQQGIVTVLKT